jgi:hypothetical protein
MCSNGGALSDELPGFFPELLGWTLYLTLYLFLRKASAGIKITIDKKLPESNQKPDHSPAMSI